MILHRLSGHLIWINFAEDRFLLQPLLTWYPYPHPAIRVSAIYEYDARVVERIQNIVLYPSGGLIDNNHDRDMATQLDFLLGVKCLGPISPFLRILVRLDDYTMRQGPEEQFWGYLEAKWAIQSFEMWNEKIVRVLWE